MEIKLYYDGEEKAEVVDGIVVFSGIDLNPLIDKNIGSITQTNLDDSEIVMFEETMPSLELKLVYMVEELGFEIEYSDGVSKKALTPEKKLEKEVTDYIKEVGKELEKGLSDLNETESSGR